MTEFALPLLFATVLWFVATGFVLWLDKLPSHTWPVSITLASVASGFAMGGIIATAEETSAWAAYVAFACALVLWGWHELSFLMGFVTLPPSSRPQGTAFEETASSTDMIQAR